MSTDESALSMETKAMPWWLIQAFKGGGWGIGIMGVIGILIGIFLLGNTILGAQMVVWLSALVLVVGGIAAIVVAFKARS